MKFIFLALFLALLAMSAVAWVIRPPTEVAGRKIITWASDDNPIRRDQIELFNSSHPNLDLRLDAVNHDLDKVVTQSLCGVGPDVFDAYGERIALLAEAGLLYDVTDQLRSRGVTLDKIWPMGRAAMSIHGRVFGVPCNIVADALWFHRDIFDQAHVPYPPAAGWKWDDFVRTCKRLTQTDSSGRVVRFAIMGMTWDDVMYTNGGRIFTPDGRRCIVASPQSIAAVQKWVDLQLVEHVMPTPVDESALATEGGWNSGALTLFQEKRLAMAAGGRWWLCQLRFVKDANGNFPFNLGVVEKPILSIRRFRGWARVAFVNATSPNRDRAIDFLTFLTSDAYADAVNMQADGVPAMMSACDRPAYDNDPFHGRDSANSPIWKSLARYAISRELSPYISYDETTNLLTKQIDEIRSGIKTVSAGLNAAQNQINAEMATNISRDAKLRRRFDDADQSPVYANFTDDQFIPDSVTEQPTGAGR